MRKVQSVQRRRRAALLLGAIHFERHALDCADRSRRRGATELRRALRGIELLDLGIVENRETAPDREIGIEVVGILTVLYITIRMGDWVGATAAAAAFMTGRLMSNIFLIGKTGR